MHYDYFECTNCLTLVTPPDSGSKVLDEYRNSAHESTLESHFAAATYAQLVQKHLTHAPDAVLDIGCSDGAFLIAMANRGSRVLEGIEPSEAAAKLVTDTRVKVHLHGFESYGTTRRFNLVTIFQTIEHLVDPHTTLKRARLLCTDDGHLMIVCHDRLSVVNRILGTRSPIFDLEHLQIFSQDGLRKLLSTCGFEIQLMQRFTNRYPLSYAMRLAGIEVSRQSFATRLTVPVPAGNIFVIAKSNRRQEA